MERRFVDFSSNYEIDDDYDANCVFEDDERWRKVTCVKCENERENDLVCECELLMVTSTLTFTVNWRTLSLERLLVG